MTAMRNAIGERVPNREGEQGAMPTQGMWNNLSSKTRARARLADVNTRPEDREQRSHAAAPRLQRQLGHADTCLQRQSKRKQQRNQRPRTCSASFVTLDSSCAVTVAAVVV